MRIIEEYHVGNRLQPVQIGLFALFEKHATATAGLVLIGPVQFSFRSFFGPMDQTFKHYPTLMLPLQGRMWAMYHKLLPLSGKLLWYVSFFITFKYLLIDTFL